MNVAELLDAAKRKIGTYAEIAKRLGIAPARVSEWRKGTFKPDASQVAQIAEMAGLPVFETVAEIEISVHPEAATVWQRALEKLKTAGVAASSILIFGMGFPAEKANANNDLAKHHGSAGIYIVASVWRMLAKWMRRTRSSFALA